LYNIRNRKRNNRKDHLNFSLISSLSFLQEVLRLVSYATNNFSPSVSSGILTVSY